MRAGVWARSVCMNESLDLGSMFYFLDEAKKRNMGAIVFNPNFNRDSSG